MDKHHWLNEVLLDATAYCIDNKLECTMELLVAATDVLQFEVSNKGNRKPLINLLQARHTGD